MIRQTANSDTVTIVQARGEGMYLGLGMVMASLAWTLKVWFAMLVPERGRWKARYRQEKRSVLTVAFKVS